MCCGPRSTICQALASGAREVVPFLEIDEALAAAEKAGARTLFLGGERKGLRIEGFDLGNSPAEYTAERDSTGGRCLSRRRMARGRCSMRDWRSSRGCGFVVNLSAVVASLKDEPRIDILCAGTDGDETREDILLAGAIVHKLSQRRAEPLERRTERCKRRARANGRRSKAASQATGENAAAIGHEQSERHAWAVRTASRSATVATYPIAPSRLAACRARLKPA